MSRKNTTTLEKSFSREHTLFYFGVWQENNLNRMEKWAGFNASNILFVRNEGGVVSVWYDLDEIEKFNEAVKRKILENEQYFQDFKNSFESRWSKLAPYMKGKQKIKDISELKDFYDEWAEWWTLMVMSMNIPEIDDLLEDVKDEALELRKQTQEYMDEGDRVFTDFFQTNFPEYEDITSVILPSEVFSLQNSALSNEKVKEIRDRKSGCAILNGKVIKNGGLQNELKKQGLESEQSGSNKLEEDPDKKRLEGQIAYEGKAVSVVKVVASTDDLKKVNEGDIIVSPMTTPDFVPAMRKAAGFVTNEGGITSHAAITAREMKKPCIVGAEIATKVFSDGDKVEVDANEGVIEVTEKNDG